MKTQLSSLKRVMKTGTHKKNNAFRTLLPRFWLVCRRLFQIHSRDEKESILDVLMEGVIIIDNQGMIRYVNPAFSKLTRLPRRELQGQPITGFVPGRQELLDRCFALIKLIQHEEDVMTIQTQPLEQFPDPCSEASF